MLTLIGFSASNYYNTVKLALLEKAIPFREKTVYVGADRSFLEQSPLGKVPCLDTERGPLVESRPILDYLEDRYPENALLPSDPFMRATVRRSMQFIELYLELEARRFLPYFFMNRTPPEKLVTLGRSVLDRAAAALPRWMSFSSYLTGSEFGLLDIWATIHLQAVTQVTSAVLGYDPLSGVPHLKDYLARMKQRPHVARVETDRKADIGPFMDHIKQRFS